MLCPAVNTLFGIVLLWHVFFYHYVRSAFTPTLCFVFMPKVLAQQPQVCEKNIFLYDVLVCTLHIATKCTKLDHFFQCKQSEEKSILKLDVLDCKDSFYVIFSCEKAVQMWCNFLLLLSVWFGVFCYYKYCYCYYCSPVKSCLFATLSLGSCWTEAYGDNDDTQLHSYWIRSNQIWHLQTIIIFMNKDGALSVTDLTMIMVIIFIMMINKMEIFHFCISSNKVK